MVIKFRRIIDYKIEMMINMVSGYLNCTELMKAIKQYHKIMKTFENQLLEFHTEASYIKSHNMLIYFYSNVMGDYR